jgi:hypothetical protein
MILGLILKYESLSLHRIITHPSLHPIFDNLIDYETHPFIHDNYIALSLRKLNYKCND